MIRDKEIERLVNYAKGLGTRVFIHSKNNNDADGEWHIDGSAIHVYNASDKNKTSVILTLIHEIAHHVWFIHEKNRNPDLKFEQAVSRVMQSNATKTQRKRLLKMETDSTAYWDIIYKETDIKIPKWKLDKQKELDIWQFIVYANTNNFPTNQEISIKTKELTLKYKPTKGK